jgi:hypothetical protein
MEEKGDGSGAAGKTRSEPSFEDLLQSRNLEGEDIENFLVPKSEMDKIAAISAASETECRVSQ